jgi:hypothetical protein
LFIRFSLIKIEFYLKKPEGEKNKLEYITISNPRKVLEGELAGQYSCELYQSDIENKQEEKLEKNLSGKFCKKK